MSIKEKIREMLDEDLKVKTSKDKPYTFKNSSIWYNKTEIGRLYVDTTPGAVDELRLLQGVPQSEVLAKIEKDLPDVYKKLKLSSNIRYKMFSK